MHNLRFSKFETNSLIYKEFDPSIHFYIVLTGKIALRFNIHKHAEKKKKEEAEREDHVKHEDKRHHLHDTKIINNFMILIFVLDCHYLNLLKRSLNLEISLVIMK